MPDAAAPNPDRSILAASAELWRLLTFKPTQSQPWRDFWKIWIPTMLVWAILMAVTGVSFLPWGLLLVAAVAFVLSQGARLYPSQRRGPRPD